MYKKYFHPIKLVELSDVCDFTQEELIEAGISFTSGFENLGIVFTGTTFPMNVVVNDMIERASFVDMLGHTANDLERQRLNGAQFADYLMSHFRSHNIKEGQTVFVVLTKGDEEVMINLSNVIITIAEKKEKGAHVHATPLVGNYCIWPNSLNPWFIFP
ncbi:MAG: hypothetical protein ABIG99_01615 [Patescibacteria group bacterium]